MYQVVCDKCGLVIKPNEHWRVNVFKYKGMTEEAKDRNLDFHSKCLRKLNVIPTKRKRQP